MVAQLLKKRTRGNGSGAGDGGAKSDPSSRLEDPGADLRPPGAVLLLSLCLVPISLLPPQLNPLPSLLPFPLRVSLLCAVFLWCAGSTALRSWRAFFQPVLRVRQDVRYHAFADRRSLGCGCGLSVPNAADVASNFPFLVVGALGILVCSIGGPGVFAAEQERLPYLAFFAGVFAVGFGSAYYHWNPRNATLVWDRLPMTVGFVASYCALLEERIGGGVGIALLPYAVAAGAASVFYWHYTDDLTPYAFVQFFPLTTIPLLCALFPAPYTHAGLVIACVAVYAAAKVAESNDREIFERTGGVVSGHSLKHIVSAAGPLLLVHMLAAREKVDSV